MSLIPRPEYPRPRFCRSAWTNLNGEWAFAFDDKNEGLRQGWQGTTAQEVRSGSSPFDRRITVPYCYQAKLSGICERAFHDVIWYARTFDSPPSNEDCLLLHFGAVDYRATVWVNGVWVVSHEGGHTPFSADVTSALLREGENVLVVRAEDPSRDVTIPRGKQYWREQSEGIFYTRTTGIWQTVWLEPVNRRRIETLRLTPDVDAAAVDVDVRIEGHEAGLALRLLISREGEKVLDDRAELLSPILQRSLPLLAHGAAPDTPHLSEWPRPALWSPEHPNLYDLRLELLDVEGEVLDVVGSYFGMRKVEA